MKIATIGVLALAAAPMEYRGCMTSPANGSTVCGTHADISLTGYAAQPGAAVTLEAGPSPNGPFYGLTSLTAAGASGALTLNDGTKVYAWSGNARAPFEAWGTASGGKRSTYVRATIRAAGGGPYASYTFEAGSPWLQCMSDEMERGRSAKQAADRCKASSSPVARVEAPERSTCALRRRAWQASCTGNPADPPPSRYLVVPRTDRARPCRADASLAGWTLSSLYGDAGPGVCIAVWGRTTAPGTAELDALEDFASPYRRIDKPDTPVGAPSMDRTKSEFRPAIYADCAPSRRSCTSSSCPSLTGTPVPDGHGEYLTDMSSGCPKCAVTENGMIFAAIPPEYRSIPLSISHPNGAGGVLRVDPQGEQVFVVPPPAEGLGEFFDESSAQEGATFTVTPACWYDARVEARRGGREPVCNPDGSYKAPR